MKRKHSFYSAKLTKVESSILDEIAPFIEGLYENDPTTIVLNEAGEVARWYNKAQRGGFLAKNIETIYPDSALPLWNEEGKSLVFDDARNTILAQEIGYFQVGAIVVYAKIREYPDSDFGGLVGGGYDYRLMYDTSGDLLEANGSPFPFTGNFRVNGLSGKRVPLGIYSTITGFSSAIEFQAFGNGIFMIGKNFGASDPYGRDGSFDIKGLIVLNTNNLEVIKKAENYLRTL